MSPERRRPLTRLSLGLSLNAALTLGGCTEAELHPQTPDEAGEGGAPISVAPDPSCEGLFGAPSERSGLTELECNLSCQCEGGERSQTSLDLSSPVLSYIDQSPPALIGANPYEDPALMSADQSVLGASVCVLELDHATQRYQLTTRPITEAPPELITHTGPCGACSSMQDLKVYLSRTDLADPVRRCGLEGISQGAEASARCLSELGFSAPCAEIWAYNTQHTRERCLEPCLAHLNSSYVSQEGELNPCLACDEEESGPIFKRVAGRTRRNSGLPSAICRPCSSVSALSHAYLTIAP